VADLLARAPTLGRSRAEHPGRVALPALWVAATSVAPPPTGRSRLGQALLPPTSIPTPATPSLARMRPRPTLTSRPRAHSADGVPPLAVFLARSLLAHPKRPADREHWLTIAGSVTGRAASTLSSPARTAVSTRPRPTSRWHTPKHSPPSSAPAMDATSSQGSAAPTPATSPSDVYSTPPSEALPSPDDRPFTERGRTLRPTAGGDDAKIPGKRSLGCADVICWSGDGDLRAPGSSARADGTSVTHLVQLGAGTAALPHVDELVVRAGKITPLDAPGPAGLGLLEAGGRAEGVPGLQPPPDRCRRAPRRSPRAQVWTTAEPVVAS